MTIPLSCACGARYQIRDEFAGRRTKCRKCGRGLGVPNSDGPLDVVLVEEEPVLLAEVVEEPPARSNEPVVMIDDEADDDDRLPRKKNRQSSAPAKKRGGHFSVEKGLTNKGIVGGLVMIVLAVVWFVGALVYL